MTRREFFSNLIPGRWVAATTPGAHRASAQKDPEPAARVAVIAGRHCLAYQGSFCSTCRERCPIPGAVVIERGLPRINPDLCNGCRVCHDLCPAPTNAILLVNNNPASAGRPTLIPSTSHG